MHSSHCPWIHNCVGGNNIRHFLLYVIVLEAGIILYISLVVYRKSNTPQRLSSQPLTDARYSRFASTFKFSMQCTIGKYMQLRPSGPIYDDSESMDLPPDDLGDDAYGRSTNTGRKGGDHI